MVKRRRTSPGTLITAVLILSMVISALWQLSECPTSRGYFLPQNSTSRYFLLLPENSTTSSVLHPFTNLQRNDFSRLIDLNNFTFTMNHQDVCRGSELLLLILVHSNPSNTQKRKSIRKTWGSVVSSRFKLLFLVGIPSSKKLETMLEKENESTKDLIQGNFVDVYRNLTYKHVMALKWTVYFCPNAKYLLKTDDDVFVNTPALLNFINSNLSPFGARGLMLCRPKLIEKVQRSWRSKWKVTFSEYKHPYFPPFCVGFIILYSTDVVFNLYAAAQTSEYFWVDDVHVTGFMAAKANYSPFSLERRFFLTQSDMESLWKNESSFTSFLFGPPDLAINDIFKLWKKTLPP